MTHGNRGFWILALLLAVLAGGMGACAKKSSSASGEEKGAKKVAGASEIPTGSLSTLDERGLVREAGQGEALVKDALFAYDSAELTAQARGVLDEAAKILKSNQNWSLIVEGHCDERGTEEYNLGLGQRRAHAAASYLKSKGIAAERLDPVSFGKAYPADSRSNEEAWTKNRRVHLGFEKPPAVSAE